MILQRRTKTVREVCELSAASIGAKIPFAKNITLRKYFHVCQVGPEERRRIMECANSKTKRIELQLGEVLG
ncbi:MAG: hypothetical protein QW568_03920 [Candidatus Anstonellaceae archaeon]